jgi:hypothetical protein
MNFMVWDLVDDPVIGEGTGNVYPQLGEKNGSGMSPIPLEAMQFPHIETNWNPSLEEGNREIKASSDALLRG